MRVGDRRSSVARRAGRNPRPAAGHRRRAPSRAPWRMSFHITAGFRRIEAMMRLEPDAIAVGEADDRDGER